MNINMKKETVKVDKNFLMKVAKKVDDLSIEVKELTGEKKEVDEDKPRFQFSCTLQVKNLETSGEIQKSFIDELKMLMARYPLKRLNIDFKK